MKSARNLNRAGRLLFLAAAFVLLATIARPGPPRPTAPPGTAPLAAAPVPLDRDDPALRRAGALVFLGGWALTSPDPRFGGISAMHVEDGEVIAVSDAGTLLRFALPRRRGGAGTVRIAPLTAGEASRLGSDVEAMAVHAGRFWVALERANLIARFRRGGWRLEAAARPPAMRRWPGNSGAEAMVRLADGRFLVFAEGRSAAPESPVLLFDGDPAEPGARAAPLRYRKPPGHRVTDAALLPDGRLLLLSRRVGWLGRFSARLAVAPADGLREGATIEGREIAALAAPLTVDNMEALSVAEEGGRTIVRIASDDNFMGMQRTLLLEFRLAEEAR